MKFSNNSHLLFPIEIKTLILIIVRGGGQKYPLGQAEPTPDATLPVGYYTLLFRVDTTSDLPHSFALDNISVTSCDYPPSTFIDDNAGLLTFSCNFDDSTMCEMDSGKPYTIPTHNFTRVTGDTVPNRELKPVRDHTTNSTSGGFIYWNRHSPFTPKDFGAIHISKPFDKNWGMCVRFAYYVKSSITNQNGTTLDDSQEWQVVLAPMLNYVCMKKFYFSVSQKRTVEVSVAVDDIEAGQCNTLIPVTQSSARQLLHLNGFD